MDKTILYYAIKALPSFSTALIRRKSIEEGIMNKNEGFDS